MDGVFKSELADRFDSAYEESGKLGVAKFYAELRMEIEKQLEIFMELEVN